MSAVAADEPVPPARGAAAERVAPANHDVQQATLARIQQRLAALPLLPQVLMRLLQLDRNADQLFEQVHELVRGDPGLAVRLLRYANSAAVASPVPANSIERAMLVVGTEGVLKLALTFSAIRVFVPHLEWQKNLWRHAFDVAFLMQAFAHHVAGPAAALTASPDEAYLFGLLHDIGRFVLYLEAPAEIQAVEETDWASPEQLVASELRLCGFTHAEVGYLAIKRWELDDTLALRVRHHHSASAWNSGQTEADRTMLELSRLADALSIRAGLDRPLRELKDGELDVILQKARCASWLAGTATEQRGWIRGALQESARLQDALGVQPAGLPKGPVAAPRPRG